SPLSCRWLRCASRSLTSHLTATGKRPTERDLVRILEITADGQAAREPRHARAVAETVGDVSGGRLARHRRVRRQHDLVDTVGVDPADQLVDAEVARLDAVDRAEGAAEHVVEAAILVRPFE